LLLFSSYIAGVTDSNLFSESVIIVLLQIHLKIWQYLGIERLAR